MPTTSISELTEGSLIPLDSTVPANTRVDEEYMTKPLNPGTGDVHNKKDDKTDFSTVENIVVMLKNATVNSTGKQKTAIAIGAATGMAIGAAVGSVLPGVGTAMAAASRTLLGGGIVRIVQTMYK